MTDDFVDQLDMLPDLDEEDGPVPRSVLMVQVMKGQGLVLHTEDDCIEVVTMFHARAELARERNDRAAWAKAMFMAQSLPIQFHALKSGRMTPGQTFSMH